MDIMNKFMVAASRSKVCIMNPPRGEMSPDDALLLAAWLVALASPMATEPFEAVLEEVENS
jgi:hypothetical protein